jgi:glutamate transport system substrate-binding protein
MEPTMRATRAAALVVVAALAVLVAVVVYRSGQASEAFSVADKGRLVIGVEDDQPGLGTKTPNGRFAGFEADVATFVAGRLGVAGDRVRFVAIHPNDWERALRTGAVDLVFASYPITPELTGRVTFAGPYYVAHQSILVRTHDESIKNVRDLAGKRVCQVAGSRSWRHIAQDLRIAAAPLSARTYLDCVELLDQGRIDAVSADDLILAGAAAAAPDSNVKLVDAPFTDERYGVGLKKGDIKGCEAVNRALMEMYQGGAASTMITQGFGSSNATTDTAPRFEGCA